MNDLAVLADAVGTSERTLRRAANQGTIRADRQSPRKLRLKLSERNYLRRHWQLLSALRSALRTEPNVRFALLFGSAATGDDASNSDVDLLVDLRDPDLDRILDLEAKLTRAVGRRVDIVRLKDADAAPLFLAEILLQGRVIVDRDRVWPRLHCHAELADAVGDHSAVDRRAALSGIDQLLSGHE